MGNFHSRKSLCHTRSQSKSDLFPGFFPGYSLQLVSVSCGFTFLFSENNLTRLLVIPIPITTFVALGYEHSIANMYFLPAGMIAQNFIEGAKI